MKKRRLLALVAATPWLWAACAPGVQPLLDDYNSMFEVTLAGQDGGGGNDRDWLQDHYRVPLNHTLNLGAPLGGTSYEWKLEPNPNSTNTTMPQSFDIEKYGGKTSHLHVDLLGEKFQEGSYLLTCTVVRGGETLTDSCIITVEKGG